MVFIQKKGSKTYSELIISLIEGLKIEGDLKKAKQILIKPNLVTTKTSSEGVTVDLNLIKYLIEVIKDISSAAITVGDNSLIDTDEVYRYLNVAELEKSGCKVENFEKNEWVEVPPPFKLLFKKILIPKTAYESDLIINFSKMKTHELTGVTLGIKNFFGLLSKGCRKYAHLHDIDQAVVDVFSYFEQNKKIISIIDGLIALSGKNGPVVGTPVNMDCLIGSTDTILGDAAAVKIMGADPLHIGHIKLASEVLGKAISEVSINESGLIKEFEFPVMFGEKVYKFDNWLYEEIFYKYPLQKDSQLCISCKRCESICPKGIVTVEGNTFKYDHDECVYCICCVEACNTGAITYKVNHESWFLFLRYCFRGISGVLKYIKR